MARLVLTNPKILIGSVDLSDHIASVTIDRKLEQVDTTAFGAAGKSAIAGLEDSSIQLAFHQDFAASSVEATIRPLIGTTTSISITPVSTTTSATNPTYSATVLVHAWNPVRGKVGDLATADVTWRVNGVISTTTS